MRRGQDEYEGEDGSGEEGGDPGTRAHRAAPSVSASEEELARPSDSEGEQAARSSDEDDEGVLDRSRRDAEVPEPHRSTPLRLR